MTLTPLSLLGGAVRPLGHSFTPKPSTRAQPPAGQGSAPAAVGTLSVRGQSIPCREPCKAQHGLQPRDRGCPQSQAAQTPGVTQPCTKTRGLPLSAQQLPGARNKAEGCEYALPYFGSAFAHRRLTSVTDEGRR